MKSTLIAPGASVAALTGDEILAIHQGVELDDIQWSPNGEKIIFRSRYTGASEFWSISRDGTMLGRLTVGSYGSTPQVSTDGKWLSYLSAKSGSREVWLHPLRAELGAVDIQLSRLGADVNTSSWAPDGRTIVLSCSRHGSYDIYEIDVPSGEWRRLTCDPNNYEHYPVYSPDGKSIVYVQLNSTWEDHSVIQMDRNGDHSRVLVKDEDFFDYQIGRRFGHPQISPDGRWLLFRSHRSNWINYWKLDLLEQKDGDGAQPIALRMEEFDQSAESGSITCGEAQWSPDSKHVAYVSNRNGNVQLRVTDIDSNKSVVVAAGEAGAATNPSWSPDGTKIAFMYQSFTKPADLWVADVEYTDGKSVCTSSSQFTQSMPRGLERKFDPPEKIEYESFDGVVIPAYLYRPREKGAEPGPAILEIHGGPHDQFRDTMHLVVQYYVQRGYTVLMPNIRGSSGLGKDFEELIKTGWGLDDLQDVIEGARHLVKEGLADSGRIGVTGQSYGGAMCMTVACSAPAGVFQAAISRTGYADWAYYSRHGSLPTVNLLRHSLGPIDENREAYDSSAALNAARTASTPLFVIDQEADPTEPPIDLRKELVARLRGLGKPVRYKKYTSTGGPYANHPSGAKEMLRDMMEYFDEYLG